MAVTINEAKEISLIDGTKLSIRPLSLSALRKFMNEFDKLTEALSSNDKALDILISCTAIAISQFDAEIAKDLDKLENNLDLPTVYEIINAASGIDLTDSSLMSIR